MSGRRERGEERRGEGEGEQCKESYVLGGMRLPRNLIMGLRARK